MLTFKQLSLIFCYAAKYVFVGVQRTGFIHILSRSALLITIKNAKSARRFLPFVPERINERPVDAQNVNKDGQFSAITIGSPCFRNLIENRPSDLCPFGEDIQVIAVHVTLVTFPSRGFPEDLDFFQLRHKRGRRLVRHVEPLGDLGDGHGGGIEQLLQNPDGYRG